MKKNHINIFSKLIWCFSLLILASCSNDDSSDELFNQAPGVRIDARIDELKSLLTVPTEGYKVIYFPKNNEYGGFTFFMKFSEDGNVEMRSDVDNNTAAISSKYDVVLRSTVELSFSTRNHIHKLSDSAIDQDLIGTGYEGNSNFQYVENIDGNIIFEDARNQAELIFEPVTDPNAWNSVDESLANRSKLIPTVTSSVFQQLVITDNAGNTTRYNLNYDALRLFTNPRTQSEDGTVSELNFGIAFTENGLKVSPVIELQGAVFEDFIYDETTELFVSENSGVTATIGFENEPAFVTNDAQDIPSLGNFLYRPSIDSNPLTSPGVGAIIDQINQDVAGFGLTFFDFIVFIDFDGADGTTYLQIRLLDPDGAAVTLFYDLRPSIQNNKVFFEYLGPFGANSVFLEPVMQPLIDLWISTEGLLYTNEGNFQNFSNLSGRFISLDNPALAVYGVWI